VKSKLGKQEVQLLAYAQMRGLRTISTGELTGPLRLSALQERELFRRLARSGLIVRVRRGLYLVPPRLPLGGSWSPDEILALNTLMADRGGTYQICGPNAFHRYGYDDQVPARVYAYNDRISGERTIGSIGLILIRTATSRLGETESFQTSKGEVAVYSSRVRTLLDAVYDWARFDGLPRAFGWIRDDLAAKRIDPVDLVRVTLGYGNVGTIRRIGLLLEREGIVGQALTRLERAVPPTSASIPWIPIRPKRGVLSRRWGVVVNDRT
jgi:predicted transcriptional regulator of viral defense system